MTEHILSDSASAWRPADQGSGLGAPPPGPVSRSESCWLCGLTTNTYQLVADGGDACATVRWYCRDTRACTERWVVARRPGGPGNTPVRT